MIPKPNDRKQHLSMTNFTSSSTITNTSKNTNALLVDCQTCWLTFPIEKIEEHADICAHTVEIFEEPQLCFLGMSEGNTFCFFLSLFKTYYCISQSDGMRADENLIIMSF